MKRLLLVLLSLLSYLQAQQGNTLTIRFAGVPTGTCAPFMLGVNNATSDEYNCTSGGAWNLISGAGGGPAFSAITSGTNTTAAMIVGTGASLTSVPQFNIGAAGTSGVLGLLGTTSGTATFTAPAVAGTNTNGITSSNVLLVPDGSSSAAAYGFTAHPNGGMIENGTDILIVSNGVASFRVLQNYEVTNSTGQFCWAGGAITVGCDTSLSRNAANVVSVGINAGTGAATTTGKVKAAGYMSVGTKFTSNAGCTESATVGGATAGQFTVGQNTACTIIVTMGDTATSPNGWACAAYDQTAVPAVAIRQTASNTTTASLLMTVATNDVIVFHCIGY